MSLTRLRTFIEVYRQRSISGAARNLNLTQPAVSQHIAGLEVAIGRSLFERQARGVAPTSAADELAADIGDKLDATEAALASARARSVELAGALQIIGHADFLAEVVSSQLIPLLEVGVRVRLQTGNSDMISQMVIEGLCDLGISTFLVSDQRLHCELIRCERVLAVAAPNVVRRISEAPSLQQALANEALLAYNLEIPLIDSWLVKNKITLESVLPALIGQDLRAIRSLLCKGFGWTALPEYLCADQLASGELVEITAPVGVTKVDYHLIWTPSALRQPRVAHARQALLWHLKS